MYIALPSPDGLVVHGWLGDVQGRHMRRSGRGRVVRVAGLSVLVPSGVLPDVYGLRATGGADVAVVLGPREHVPVPLTVAVAGAREGALRRESAAGIAWYTPWSADWEERLWAIGGRRAVLGCDGTGMAERLVTHTAAARYVRGGAADLVSVDPPAIRWHNGEASTLLVYCRDGKGHVSLPRWVCQSLAKEGVLELEEFGIGCGRLRVATDAAWWRVFCALREEEAAAVLARLESERRAALAGVGRCPECGAPVTAASRPACPCGWDGNWPLEGVMEILRRLIGRGSPVYTQYISPARGRRRPIRAPVIIRREGGVVV